MPAEQRCRYIFRYYTFNENETITSILASMNFEQFKCLIRDISQLKKMKSVDITEPWLESESLNGYKLFGLKSKNDLLSLSEFLIGVGQLKFRGTSVLFRFNKSTSDLLTYLKKPKQLLKNDVEMTEEHISGEKVSSTYELATHTVKVKRSGTLVDITRLWDLEEATTPTAFKLKNDFFLANSDNDDASKPQFDRIRSIDFFNQCSQPNEMLTGLRYFERNLKSNDGSHVKESLSWGKVDMNSMGKCLILICKHLQEIISLEDRLLKISAPCYILGYFF